MRNDAPSIRGSVESVFQNKTDFIRNGTGLLIAGILFLLLVGCGKEEPGSRAATQLPNNTSTTTQTAEGLPKACLPRLDNMRKAGHPATAEELDQWYTPIVAGENAAGTYTQAFALLKRPEGKDPALPIEKGSVLDNVISTHLAFNTAGHPHAFACPLSMLRRGPLYLVCGLTLWKRQRICQYQELTPKQKPLSDLHIGPRVEDAYLNRRSV
jgi:hypothetical protein